jgi:hypothetical protein
MIDRKQGSKIRAKGETRDQLEIGVPRLGTQCGADRGDDVSNEEQRRRSGMRRDGIGEPVEITPRGP